MTKTKHADPSSKAPKRTSRRLSIETILGQAQKQVMQRETLKIEAADIKSWATHFSASEIERLVIPKRTLARRTSKSEPLSPEETDKALRLARIGAEADRVFGDHQKASRWLRKPNPALSGQAPLELLATEIGALAVDELLGQIDHGMFV